MIRICMVLAMAGLLSCTPPKVKKEAYSVLYDTTDPLQATLQSDALWGFVEADATNVDLQIRYATLSAVDMNEIHQLERPAQQSGLFSNAINEKNRLKTFRIKFNDLFKQTDDIGASHSAIFKPILAELQYLSSIPNTKSYLVVYSNLIESSDWISFYRGKDYWLLQHRPSVIVERYLEQVPKDVSFKNVALHIVFKPKDYKDNIRFKQLREVYISVFKELHVPIHFSANLNKAQKLR